MYESINKPKSDSIIIDKEGEVLYTGDECICEAHYNDTPELMQIISKTRDRLNKLVACGQNHQNDEVLELSRKLDILIHYYIVLEIELRT